MRPPHAQAAAGAFPSASANRSTSGNARSSHAVLGLRPARFNAAVRCRAFFGDGGGNQQQSTASGSGQGQVKAKKQLQLRKSVEPAGARPTWSPADAAVPSSISAGVAAGFLTVVGGYAAARRLLAAPRAAAGLLTASPPPGTYGGGSSSLAAVEAAAAAARRQSSQDAATRGAMQSADALEAELAVMSLALQVSRHQAFSLPRSFPSPAPIPPQAPLPPLQFFSTSNCFAHTGDDVRDAYGWLPVPVCVPAY